MTTTEPQYSACTTLPWSSSAHHLCSSPNLVAILLYHRKSRPDTTFAVIWNGLSVSVTGDPTFSEIARTDTAPEINTTIATASVTM
jgi:hypothetical protein